MPLPHPCRAKSANHKVPHYVFLSSYCHYISFSSKYSLLSYYPELWFIFVSMAWDCVCELWPPTGLLFIPQMIYEYEEPRWNDIDRRNLRIRRERCPIVTFSPTNPLWTDLEAVRGQRLTAWAMARCSPYCRRLLKTPDFFHSMDISNSVRMCRSIHTYYRWTLSTLHCTINCTNLMEFA
jgi:hypothetical protein